MNLEETDLISYYWHCCNLKEKNLKKALETGKNKANIIP